MEGLLFNGTLAIRGDANDGIAFASIGPFYWGCRNYRQTIKERFANHLSRRDKERLERNRNDHPPHDVPLSVRQPEASNA